jgi:hypothetical protein
MRRPFKNAALQSGDRFVKVDAPDSIWVVAHLVDSPNQAPHAVIIFEKNHNETRMLAQSVLCDDARYRRLSQPDVMQPKVIQL